MRLGLRGFVGLAAGSAHVLFGWQQLARFARELVWIEACCVALRDGHLGGRSNIVGRDACRDRKQDCRPTQRLE